MNEHPSAQFYCHDVDLILALTDLAERWEAMPARYQDVQSLVTPILQLILPQIDHLRKNDVAKARRLVEVAAHLVVSTLAESGIDIDKQILVRRLHHGSLIE